MKMDMLRSIGKKRQGQAYCQGWVASILKFKKDWLQMYKNDDKL